MLENRSFDSVLGSLYAAGPKFFGLTPNMANLDSEGTSIPVEPTASTVTDPDPLHDLDSVSEQLIGPNQGFVVNYERKLKDSQWSQRRQVMDYQTVKSLPLLYKLAKEYAVSDQWFCSVPAQTWPNRLFVHCGTSYGKVSDRPWRWLPPTLYQGESIFRRLGKKVIDWACYSDSVPNMIMIEELAREFLRSRHDGDSHFRSMTQFQNDCKEGNLPRYSFIEPTYFNETANDDHPSHDLQFGQQIIGRVYSAVHDSDCWEQTLLLILYDEHGGFFDHVPPPTGVPAPTDPPIPGESGFAFTRLGPRVPCILISAWTTKGKVFRPPEGRFFDHTSVIATLRERWDLGAALSMRDAAAASIWSALDLPEPRKETDGFLDEINTELNALGEPPRESLLFTTPKLGLLAAAHAAITAPLAGVPILNLIPALQKRTSMNSSMAILGALVLTQAGRPSRFDPAGPTPARPGGPQAPPPR